MTPISNGNLCQRGGLAIQDRRCALRTQIRLPEITLWQNRGSKVRFIVEAARDPDQPRSSSGNGYGERESCLVFNVAL